MEFSKKLREINTLKFILLLFKLFFANKNEIFLLPFKDFFVPKWFHDFFSATVQISFFFASKVISRFFHLLLFKDLFVAKWFHEFFSDVQFFSLQIISQFSYFSLNTFLSLFLFQSDSEIFFSFFSFGFFFVKWKSMKWNQYQNISSELSRYISIQSYCPWKIFHESSFI